MSSYLASFLPYYKLYIKIGIFAQHPQQKGHFVRHHGVIPIIEMIDDLSSNSQDRKPTNEGQAVLHAALKVSNSLTPARDTLTRNAYFLLRHDTRSLTRYKSYSMPLLFLIYVLLTPLDNGR